ncbi:FbpB family small basic protein [Metabacillus sp. SLBN-84]
MQMRRRLVIQKKTFKELIDDNKKSILDDANLLDEIYEKMDNKYLVTTSREKSNESPLYRGIDKR